MTSNTDLSKAKILVVDDSLTVRMEIKEIFEALGYLVLLADNGHRCLELLKTERPDIILLDVMMPDLDGIKVCRLIKADIELKDIPVLILTSLMTIDEKIRGFQAGAEDYLVKPFVKEELLARVASHLKTGKVLRQLKIEVDERSKAQAALEKAHEELETRVKQRTLELQKANEELIKEIEQRRQAEKELEKHRIHLEDLVDERTVELTLAKEEAEAANASKSDFLARMSHEIRTPLSAVTGLINTVLKTELTGEQRDYMNKVQIASKNLLQVINDILDFSKVEAGWLELEQHPFELDQLMEQISDLFSNQVAQKDLEIIFTIAPDVPHRLNGDGGRLAQVLTNLIQNAVKFTESGEIVVGVVLDDTSEKDEARATLRFWVRDTGIGIGADMLPTLFDAFTQVDSSLTRKHVGTGLGLAICRRLVELMGGRIWVESVMGRGSTFFFTALFDVRPEKKRAITAPPDLYGLKTLVVDDSESARRVMGDMLTSFGFNVSFLDSGEKAIAEISRAAVDDPYQLALLDWKMPGTDGLEIAKRIRDLEPQGQTPIIMLVTAFGYELMRNHVITAPVDTLMQKPVKASKLFNTIMELFNQKEAMIRSDVSETAARPVRSLAGHRMLVVEDSELNRDVIVALLTETGIEVETAENGKIAVDKVAGSSPGYYDGVLMDIQMPVMDGYEATRRIREYEAQRNSTRKQPEPRIPIIALTAHALTGEREKCLAADMDDYIVKPIDAQVLDRVLLMWITARKEQGSSSNRFPGHGSSDTPLILDIQNALNRLGGRRQIYLKILEKFALECDRAHQTISRCLDDGDREQAARTAHKIKGVAATIGATGLVEVAMELEKAIMDEIPDIDGLLGNFKSRMEQTKDTVAAILASEEGGS